MGLTLMERAYTLIQQIGAVDRALVLRFTGNRGIALRWYITTIILHYTQQFLLLRDHQHVFRVDHTSRGYPYCEWHVLVSSQVHRVCGLPYLVFRWDYSVTLWLELGLLVGKVQLRWPLVCPSPRPFYAHAQSNRSHTSSPVI